MKFAQLIEYNMRNIFLEKSYTNFDGETIPDPFFIIYYYYKHNTLVHKINFKIKITICLHKNLEMWSLKEKQTKTTNKQTNKRNRQNKKTEQEIPSQPNPFFRKIFHMQFTCFYLKILLSKHKPFMLWNNVIYYVPFPCKSNCFLWIR